MRDFRDAKAMAQTLRAALATKGLRVTISESLELIAQAFGVADWNTLSAAIRAGAVRPGNNASPPMFPRTATLHRAFAYATERRHPYETLEHLLLALIDDVDASAVMKACKVDLSALRDKLTRYVDNDLKPRVIDNDGEPKRSAAFERVLQRAAHYAEWRGQDWTGAELLLAIFAEAESPAARLLDEQGLTYQDAVNFIIHGTRQRHRPRHRRKGSRGRRSLGRVCESKLDVSCWPGAAHPLRRTARRLLGYFIRRVDGDHTAARDPNSPPSTVFSRDAHHSSQRRAT